ncbi:MAG: tRNA (adenosine(37)-N6)-dimethylallyltransferase MiaA [Oculatellaceae cyanobacterium bins.114]|nr:tRNA (adenosine(37)-N6)-dimethylallyltransferase MiaA [Oculatellaceae cyanobacterium bins.114]
MPVPILIVICGPTASGKSGLALKLAQQLNAVILSADSRQVYREFDIGTAKPTPMEQTQVPHYFIDICDPTETFTVAEYQHQAQQVIQQLHQSVPRVGSEEEVIQNSKLKTQNSTLKAASHPSTHQPIPLLVGGTGLYIRSIVQGLKIPRVPPQAELRSQLKQMGQSQCYVFLQQVDPPSADKIHPNDEVRTLRALEVFYTTGQPLSQQQGEDPPCYPILQIGLDCLSSAETDPLTHRIEQRTQQMIAAGFVDEVQQLCDKYGVDLPLLNTLGYAEIKPYLTGDLSLTEAIAQIVVHTRQFAKRQRTWFRADKTIQWFDSDDPHLFERVWERVQPFLAAAADSAEHQT